MQSAFKENGALDQLGSRYFRKMYSDQINSDEYRKVLRAMADCAEKYVSKQHIREQTGLGETTLGNALRALKTKGTIVEHPENKVTISCLPIRLLCGFGCRANEQINSKKAKRSSLLVMSVHPFANLGAGRPS